MTTSEHYTWATVSALPGEPDFGELDIEGGSITLDSSRWPHVTATVRTPSKPGLFDRLDSRTTPRRVTLSCGENIGGLHRQFNLSVRNVQAGADGFLVVDLASDEALLEDAAPTSDVRPWDAFRTYGYTAGGVARMVLSDIGATVANPNPNPSLMPYWQLKNRVTNPRFQSTTKGAGSLTGTSNLLSNSHTAAGSTSLRALQWTCATAGGTVMVAGLDPVSGKVTALPVKGSQSIWEVSPDDEFISVSVDVSAVAPNRDQWLEIMFHGEDGSSGGVASVSPIKRAPDTRWVTHTWVGRPTPRAAYVSIRVVGGAIASTADQRMFARNVCLFDWDDVVTPFNGATPDSGGYLFRWDDATDDSPSTRYPVAERDPNAFERSAGQGGMSYLEPLLQSVGLRLVCDESRQWTLRHRDHVQAGGPVSLTSGQNLLDYNIEADIEAWCDAATVRYEWERLGRKQQREDTFEAVTPPRKRTVLTIESPFPGAGRAENIVRRAQKTTTASATAVSNWAAKAEQTVTIQTPEATVTGTIGALTFDLDEDEMTVEARRD